MFAQALFDLPVLLPVCPFLPTAVPDIVVVDEAHQLKSAEGPSDQSAL